MNCKKLENPPKIISLFLALFLNHVLEPFTSIIVLSLVLQSFS